MNVAGLIRRPVAVQGCNLCRGPGEQSGLRSSEDRRKQVIIIRGTAILYRGVEPPETASAPADQLQDRGEPQAQSVPTILKVTHDLVCRGGLMPRRVGYARLPCLLVSVQRIRRRCFTQARRAMETHPCKQGSRA